MSTSMGSPFKEPGKQRTRGASLQLHKPRRFLERSGNLEEGRQDGNGPICRGGGRSTSP